MSAPELYEKIRAAIPKGLFLQQKNLESAAIDLYLTATAARPACIPFDGENTEGGMSADEMIRTLKKKPTLLKALKAIPELTVKIGPQQDTGDAVLVANTKKLPSLQPLLHRLEVLTAEEKKGGTPKQELGETHILMGTLLGYTCPLDMKEIFAAPKVDDIRFMIDETTHMGVWCPKKKAYTKKARQQLKTLNRVLKPIGKRATLKISRARIFD